MDDLYQTPTNSVNNTIATGTSQNQNSQPSLFAGFDFNGIGTATIVIFISVILIYFLGKLGVNIYRKNFYNKKKLTDWKETVFLEITVPQETAEQTQKDQGSKKDDKESIAIGEQMFLVMNEFSKAKWKKYFYGTERFSLEIVNIDSEIRFWMGCSKKTVDLLERQIISVYPKASIARLKDVDFFKENTVAFSQELGLVNRFELPFRTYKMMETDALNSLTNVMGNLGKEESAAIQLILTPIKNSWQKKPGVLASRIQQGQNPNEVLNPKKDYTKVLKGIFKFVFDSLKGESKDTNINEKKERKIDLSGKEIELRLTPQQQEMIKKLEEKASRPGFNFSLRVVASAANDIRAKQIVDQIVPAFQVFEINPFNGFKRVKSDPKESLVNFLMRAPNFDQKSIINTEEVNSIWHLPNYLTQTPEIRWLLARKPAIPLIVPGPGPGNIKLGTANARGQTKDVYIKTEDRFRHVYALGGSGSGKTFLMTNVILEDMKMGNGVCVVDPHGELIDELLLRVPPERAEDVIVFSPAYTDRPLGLNMLQVDPLKPTQKTLVIETLFNIWDKLYDLKKTGGPMFESYMKNSMRLVMSHVESGSTLMEIPKVLSDEDFRTFKLAMCDDQEVVDFWEKEATKAGGEASLENMVPYITSKLAPFTTNDFLRPMIGQQNSCINFREAMDNKKIILVSLAKGLIGENSAYLVGMVMIGGLLMAGMGRNDGLKYNLDGTTTEIESKDRTPFFVYIDEMQNFLFDSIPKALEEIRKYKVGFYLAHQFVKQLVVDGNERIKDSIMANCATKFIYRVGADDATYLEKEFGPTLTAPDLINPEARTANAILLVDGQKTTPFNFLPDGAWAKQSNSELRKQIIENTKQKYGKPKEEVEKEIRDRAKLLF
jgi:hypothetical protein